MELDEAKKVQDFKFKILKKVITNPKNNLYFLVKDIDIENNKCKLKCIETAKSGEVKLSWIKNWIVL